MIVVLEGLPACGKTTVAKWLGSSGFALVNESLGYLSNTGNQKKIFQETIEKYKKAKLIQNAVIDRGYPSMLAWDYCALKLGLADNFQEKFNWVTDASKLGLIYEPDLYIYLKGSPSLSLSRRPRKETSLDVWSSFLGMEYCIDYYDNFFSDSKIQSKTLVINSEDTIFNVQRKIAEFAF